MQQPDGMSLRGRPGSGSHPYAAAQNGYTPYGSDAQPPPNAVGYTVPVPVSVYAEQDTYQVSQHHNTLGEQLARILMHH